MPISFPCLTCSKKLRVDDEYVGKKAKCPTPGCPAIATVPTVAVAEWIKTYDALNLVGKSINSFLHVAMDLAIANNREDVMRWIMKQRSDIDLNSVKWNERGSTFMHTAALAGQLDTMKHLKDHGAKINIPMNDGRMPIHLAAGGGHFDAVKWLLDQDKEQAKEKKLANAKEKNGRTPMHAAAMTGQVDVMKLLKERGGNVNAQDADGHQPIHAAAFSEQPESLICLVNDLGVNVNGVDVNEKDEFGGTPLHITVFKGSTASIKCLVKDLNADVNAPNKYGATPIFLAAADENIQCMDYFYELCKKLNKPLKLEINDGMTLRHFADLNNLPQVKRWLDKKGLP